MSSIHIIQGDFKEKLELPIAEGLKAGFPSPAEDYSHETIDFNRDMIHNPEATFYGKVEGDSMMEVGICDGDIAVIDRSIEANSNSLTCDIKRMDISSCDQPTRTSNPSESHQRMTSLFGALWSGQSSTGDKTRILCTASLTVITATSHVSVSFGQT